ncbi:MAG: OmpA family protein [Thermodesulfobacteriota bacterium]
MKKQGCVLFLMLLLLAWAGRGQAQDDLLVKTSRPDAKVSFETVDEARMLVSVLDGEGDAVRGLGRDDFQILKGPKTAKIVSVEDVSEQRDLGLNIVLVVDNSLSMKQRAAVDPLLAALDDFLSLVRPIDNVNVVTFVDTPKVSGNQGANPTGVSTRVFKSGDREDLRLHLRSSYYPGTTVGTYLYDAMAKGLEIIGQMPAKGQKFLVVFSDGEDINSYVRASSVDAAAAGVKNFSAFAVDYMDRPGLDAFLKSFAESHSGEIRKATSADDFLPIFKRFSTTIFHRYMVTYRFLDPPAGTLASEPAAITVEEITMMDSSPLLNYIYFDEGRSDIPARYATFRHMGDARDFAEEKLKGTMEKYHHVLNVIGKRLVDNPDARIAILGCNSNKGTEKGNVALSRRRAEAVLYYFKYVWGIGPERMEIKAQNLPPVPSTSRIPEGVVENQRVEIHSDHPAILDTIKSTYIEQQSDATRIRILPAIEAEAGIAGWQINLMNGDRVLTTEEGRDELPAEVVFDLEPFGMDKIAEMGRLSAEIEVRDKEGNVYRTATVTPTTINFLRREERIAQKIGYKVVERYGLILFEYDRAELKDRNESIVNRVIARARVLPSAAMEISGHTDIIGKEAYNLELSQRRAKAVFDAIARTGIATDQIIFFGKGPVDPPYDNALPEGRALNRTVLIALSYTE